MKSYCFTCGKWRKLRNAICQACADAWPHTKPKGDY